MFKKKSITKKMAVIVLSALMLTNTFISGIRFSLANEYEDVETEYLVDYVGQYPEMVEMFYPFDYWENMATEREPYIQEIQQLTRELGSRLHSPFTLRSFEPFVTSDNLNELLEFEYLLEWNENYRGIFQDGEYLGRADFVLWSPHPEWGQRSLNELGALGAILYTSRLDVLAYYSGLGFEVREIGFPTGNIGSLPLPVHAQQMERELINRIRIATDDEFEWSFQDMSWGGDIEIEKLSLVIDILNEVISSVPETGLEQDVSHIQIINQNRVNFYNDAMEILNNGEEPTPPPVTVDRESIEAMNNFLNANTSENRVVIPANAITETEILTAITNVLNGIEGLSENVSVNLIRQDNTAFTANQINNITVELSVNPTYEIANQTIYFRHAIEDDNGTGGNNNQNEDGNNNYNRPSLPQTGANSLNVALLGVVSANIGLVSAIIKGKKKPL